MGPGPAAAVGVAGRRKAVTETDWDRGGMPPPQSQPGAPALEVWAAQVRETDPPPDVAAPLDWMLLCSDGDRTPDTARRLARCCAAR